MSGDVQPRKRKDKKRKKDDVDEIIKERTVPTVTTTPVNPSGVHASKMVGPDDVQIHVHKDGHGTGGHWCAKVVFFSLLAILVGLIGLIILENRGHTDVDTPVAESRFSEYFEGWVEEVKDGGHDEHDVLESIQESDDHDKDDEPFAEEDDHDDENGDHNEHDDHYDENDEEDDDEQNSQENDSAEEEAEIENNNENEVNLSDENEEKNTLEEDDADDNNDDDNDDEEDVKEQIKEEEVVRYTRSVGVGAQPIQAVEESNEVFEEDTNSNENKEDNNENSDEVITQEENVKANDNEIDDNDNDNTDDDDDDDTPFEEHEKKTEKNQTLIITGDLLEKQVDDLIENYNKLADSLNRPRFIENNTKTVSINNEKETVHNDGEIINDAKMEDDDSFEEVIDNDDGEELHLQRLAEEKKEAEKSNENTDNKPESSSIAVKIVVGVALFIVAHLVLVKKPETKDDRNIKDVKPVDEHVVTTKEAPTVAAESVDLHRKLTLITTNESIPIGPEDEIVYDDDDELYDDNDLDEELYENRLEDDDEEIIEYSDDENFINENVPPQTFEDMNAMFKVPNVPDKKQQPEIIKDKSPARNVFIEPKISQPVSQINKTFAEPIKPQQVPATTSEIPQQLAKQQVKIEPANLQFGEVKPFEVKNKNDKEDEELLLDEGDDDEEIDEGDVIEIDEDEEDISDVDDSDLMKRLEAKYGKLPVQLDISDEEADEEELDEDEEDVDDEEFNSKWTKLPAGRGPQTVNEDQIYDELSRANNMLHEYPKESIKLFEQILQTNPNLPEALYGKARALDRLSDIEKINGILQKAIDTYLLVLDSDNQITDEIFKAVAERCIDRIRFIGQHVKAVEVHEKLIKRFNDEPKYRNQLALTLLLSNRLAEAKKVLHETLLRWRTDGFALAHYGFVLKNLDQDMVNAVKYLREGILSGAPGTNDGRFYFNLGDALIRLGRNEEARAIYRDGANKKLFLSEYQRSLYNVERLTARPFWTKEQTTYEHFFNVLEQNWLQIRDEGLNLLNNDGNFKDVVENLRDVGDWKQFELYARGHKIVNNCNKVMLTCKIIEMFPQAKTCSRGQVKFSVMQPGTHVWSHCGPTNCRLRAHLGLQVPSKTYLRVATETRSWENGKFLIFDDSFEHEVWHNGTTTRLVLIIDVWHPDLTDNERKTLTRI